ncbi:MAG: glutathione S-transferase family protein [Hyphomonadaceae bacterium]
MAARTLYIGNKNYSSWSMRPWLALKWAGIAFEEQVRQIGAGPGYGMQRAPHILAVSPSGRVPVLHADGYTVHDSLAICEWAHEQAGNLWPADPAARALARSIAAEIHSGYMGLRRELGMNLKRRMDAPPALSEDVQRDLERLFAAWEDARARFAADGPFLFGARSIADAMYAPVATRLRTYAVPAPPAARDYCAAIFSDPAFQEWERDALAETWTMPSVDGLFA